MPVLLVPGNFLESNGADKAEKIVTMTVDELLPMGFGPEHLPKSVQGSKGSQDLEMVA